MHEMKNENALHCMICSSHFTGAHRYPITEVSVRWSTTI